MAINIDPVDGLVSYTEFTKPYHTKILEILVEYIHDDCIDVTITEDFYISLGMPDPSLLPYWGLTEDEAKKFFNCDFKKFQLSDVDSGSGYWEVVGDASSDIEIGDVILLQTYELVFQPYTVTNVVIETGNVIVNDPYYGHKEGSPLTIDYTSYTSTRTKLYVSESISPLAKANGAVVPASCYSEFPETYVPRSGIVFPSPHHVNKNQDCGGFGSIFQEASGSPPGFSNGLDTANQILSVSTSPMYFEIDNTAGIPSVISAWQDAFTYGRKFTVTGSTGNDSDDYTVLFSLLASGSPPRLRIYTLENISSSIADGNLQLRPWGYDEPDVCINTGQGLLAQSTISENMSITVNDNFVNDIDSFDMQGFDMGGFDGGEFTYLVAFT